MQCTQLRQLRIKAMSHWHAVHTSQLELKLSSKYYKMRFNGPESHIEDLSTASPLQEYQQVLCKIRFLSRRRRSLSC